MAKIIVWKGLVTIRSDRRLRIVELLLAIHFIAMAFLLINAAISYFIGIGFAYFIRYPLWFCLYISGFLLCFYVVKAVNNDICLYLFICSNLFY